MKLDIEELRKALHEVNNKGKPLPRIIISSFIKAISINGFRCFPAVNNEEDTFKISFNVPEAHKPESGLTILIGENNTGKSTVLDALELFFADEDKEFVDRIINSESTNTYPGEFEIILTISNSEKFCLKTTFGEFRFDKKILKSRRIKNFSRRSNEAKDRFYCCLNEVECRHWENNQKHDSFDFREEIEEEMEENDVGYLKEIMENMLFGRKFLKKVFDVSIEGKAEEYNEISELKPHRSLPAWQLGDGVLQSGHLVGAIQKHQKDGCRLFLLDEPEQNLHPKAIEILIDELWEIAKNIQIVLTSHSPILVEAVCRKVQTASSETGKKPEDYFRIFSKDAKTGAIRTKSAKPFLLNPVSADEINYCAFDYVKENYFVQLYDVLKYKWAQRIGKDEISQKEMDKIFNKEGYSSDQHSTVKDVKKEETIFTYQRNALAHPTNKSRTFQPDKLKWCIEELRKLLNPKTEGKL